MSNRLFQSIVYQMRNVVDRTIGVVDEMATVIACSDLSRVGGSDSNISQDVMATPVTFIINGYTYKAFGSTPRSEYAVFVEGNDETAQKYAMMLAISLSSVKQYHDEKFDRKNFIRNVLLDNILPGDIYLRARELRFNSEVERICFVIRVASKHGKTSYDIIESLFPDKTKDFVISINETDVALVKELKSTNKPEDIENLAVSILDTLSAQSYPDSVVSIGTVVKGIKNLAKSFKAAQVAIEVGKVFDTQRSIINYENLGIARLIYQLPTTLCEMFLNEIFKQGSIDALDKETLFTIQKFFENSLNVSETSRKLFIHRNTLVYRLEKVKKITGLDLREFEDAIVFKVALMVKRYLKANPTKF